LIPIGIVIALFVSILALGDDDKKTNNNIYGLKTTSERITSIQYQQVKETYGLGDGKIIENTRITYVYPDKLKIENNGKIKSVEIYVNDKYLYYDVQSNKAKYKECFSPDEPYITEIEKKMINILRNGEYEFFGYEERDNRRLEVIGVKSKSDGHSYMHKMWITEINKVILPYKEEYFIDNAVVSKIDYEYFNVNEPVNPEVFEIKAPNAPEKIEDGVLGKYVESFEEAQKYLNFKLILPEELPLGVIPSEIAVVPPVKKPSFSCIYFKEGYRIYLYEDVDEDEFKPNRILGKYPCEFTIEDEKALLVWNQRGISITLSGDEAILSDIIYMAEQMTGGRLVKNEKFN
jgi:hypothetical protein